MSRSNGATTLILRRAADTVVAALTRLFRPVDWRRGFAPFDDPQRLTLIAAAVVAALLLGMWLIDAAAIRAVQHWSHALVRLLDWFTDFGKSGWFLWPLGLLFLALAALPRKLGRVDQAVFAAIMVRVGFLFTAIAVTGIAASLIKNMIGRARPLVGGSLNPALFDPFHWAPSYASLPSGHATTAFSVLAAFGALWPRARTALLIYALLIAVSRVAVTAHYPTDVAAGAVFGIGGVLLVRRWFALQKLGFSIGPDGQLRQFPGPSVRRIKSVARGLLA
jgi:undecaprenyl-diphosphatase